MTHRAQTVEPSANETKLPPVGRRELIALALTVLAAALIRLAYVPSGGDWSIDQGTEMLGVWKACVTGQLPLYGSAATSIGSPFHHGALFYDALVPVSCLTHGDPRAALVEIIAINLAVIPMLWWMARSIGGRFAGLVVAILAATSTDFVLYSTFIWNPMLVVPGATLAFLGAWEATRTGRGKWWLAVGAGFAVASESHVAAGILILPLGAVFLADLLRAPAGRRLRTFGWGVAAAAIVFLVYSPVIVAELLNGFPEMRGILGYLGTSPGYVEVSPAARVLFTAIRVVAWPLTGWPFYDLHTAFPIAALVSFGLMVALGVLVYRVWRQGRSATGGEIPATTERQGLLFVACCLVILIFGFGLGLRAVSELNRSLNEHYHIVVDPLVLIAAATLLGALWHVGSSGTKEAAVATPDAAAAGGASARARAGRIAAVLLTVALVVWNVAHWPSLTEPDNWDDARTATTRIETLAGGDSIGLVGLQGLPPDAYVYPLTLDGARIADPSSSALVVVMCDMRAIDDCGGQAESRWLAVSSTARGLTLVDRWLAAPTTTLSVYRRSGQ